MAKKESRIKSHDYQRQMLREVVKEVVGEGSDALFKRSLETEDLFDSLYDELDLLQPVYGFDNLYLIYEQSDVLQSCVEAMQQNVDGFGYQMQFLGDDVKDKDKKEALEQRVKAENFFDQVNPEESFMKIRKNAREDLEVLGSMAFECIRNKAGELMMMFHVPFKNLRMSKKESNPVEIEVPLWRNGKLIKVRYKRRFRKWAQVDSVNRKVRWFREFGDQRPMQALTGKIDKNGEQASEILHIKLQFGGMAYGLPRWVGAVLEAIGRRNAQYVNWDLFESQGIPPMAVLVSGGVLTDTSIEELKTIIRSMRGVDKWNRIMLLESSVESVGLDDKGTAKLELKNLSEYRKDDQMFDRYLTSTEKNLRHRFRLPPLYVGGAETFTHATAKAAQNVAEEQVFIPARTEFDEMVNRKLVQNELGIDLWKYTTKGPRIVGASEISSAVEIFGKSGAFTVNHAIRMANDAFGLQMSPYDAEWANYPLPIVLEVLKSGKLDGLDDIMVKDEPDTTEGNLGQIGFQEGDATQPLLPAVTQKMLGSDMFTDQEKDLYRLLVTMQSMIERTTRRSPSEHTEL